MKTHKVLGIMSGTSLDGVDYALCEISAANIKLKKLWSADYPSALQKRLHLAAIDKLSSYGLSQLHHDLGRFYAAKAPNVKFDYIGMHGQTIFHNPTKNFGATMQIGEPTYLAARFGVSVINQFRTMDLALGGQGAPLATIFHRDVFSLKNKTVAVNNLGGISNVTYLPTHGKILSFDTGPANMLINYAVEKITSGKIDFDKGGAIARTGIANQNLIARWLKNLFFNQKPPKSTGREDFGRDYFEKLWSQIKKARISNADAVATFTDFTAQSIALNYDRHLPKLPDLVVLVGGGASNPVLQKMIRIQLRTLQWKKFGDKINQPLDVIASDELGWPAQSIEPAAWAYLAFLNQNKFHGNIPETTGARRAAVLGSVTPAP